MTKEDLYNEFTNEGTCTNSFAFKLLEEFFESNVCIPKGNNRHPDADALHSYAEGEKMQFMIPAQTDWIDDECRARYRIKPSEPVWEYMYYDSEGKIDWLTEDEYQLMMESEPIECYKALETKLERK